LESNKPTNVGTYWIAAEIAPTSNYNGATTEAVKFTIGKKTIDTAAIAGVAVPLSNATPVAAITETEQYTGTVSWNPEISEGKFANDTEYTATITLTPTANYTLTGVEEDFFTVDGADTVTYTAGSNTVTAAFPKTDKINFTVSATGAATQAATRDSFPLDLVASTSTQTITLTGNIAGDNLTGNPITWSGENKWSFSAGDTADAGTKTITIPASTVGSLVITATAKDNSAKTLTITINVTHSGFTLDWCAYNTNYCITKDVPYAKINESAAGVNYDHGSIANTATTSRIFRARLFKGGTTVDAAATVNWSVEEESGSTGATWDESTKTATGSTNFLNIPANYAGTISVKVSSDANPGYDVTFDIEVDVRPEVATTQRSLTGADIGDDSSDWLEIATKGDYSLIVRKTALTGTVAFGAVNNNYLQSTLRGKINTWYAGLVEADSALVENAVTHNAISRLGTAMIKVDDGYSLPLGETPETTTDIAFPLSSSEAISFLSKQHYVQNSWQRVSSSSEAAANWNELAVGGGWFRSPCSAVANNAAALDSQGDASSGPIDATYWSVRPALWVSSDIFDIEE
jgi:hypothetical protein